MPKFKASKVASGKKGANYSTGKQFNFRSQEEAIERRKELLQKKSKKQED